MTDLLTTAQVAARYGVTIRRVQALAKSRGIGTRYGERVILFTPEDVERLQPMPPGKRWQPKP